MRESGYSEAIRRLLRPEVGGLPAYDPGADPETVLLDYGLERIVKLSNNENPYGISPLAAQAIQQRLAQGLGRYPDPAGKDLCRALAQRHGIARERIIPEFNT